MTLSRPQAGFTLLEIIVAVAVFAVMAAMAYGGLNTVLDTRERAMKHNQRTAQIQIAVSHLSRDLEQFATRGIRDQFGDRQAAFIADPRHRYPLEFTRHGWRNPLEARRSTLQRVAWQLEDNTLTRYYWRHLDRADGAEPLRQPLLEEVDEIRLRFLDTAMEWHEQWPPLNVPPDREGGSPIAVEFVLELEDRGRIRRLINLPGGR